MLLRVASGIGLAYGRIGAQVPAARPGFGGSCFPRITMARMRIARRRAGAPSRLVETVLPSIDARKSGNGARSPAARALCAGKGDRRMGCRSKRRDRDRRDSPQSRIVARRLAKNGAIVSAYDPREGGGAARCAGSVEPIAATTMRAAQGAGRTRAGDGRNHSANCRGGVRGRAIAWTGCWWICANV